jgi:hypothetical protein
MHLEHYIADSDKTTAVLSDDLSIEFVPSAKLATSLDRFRQMEGRPGNASHITGHHCDVSLCHYCILQEIKIKAGNLLRFSEYVYSSSENRTALIRQ